MKTRIFYGNQHISSFNCDGKRYTRTQRMVLSLKRFAKASAFIGISSAFVVGFAMGYDHFNAKTAYAEKIVTVQVPSNDIPPVLMRIIQCESGTRHYDRNGQVLMNPNVSEGHKSVDIGIGQINQYYWGKKASELGYNLTNEDDNLAFTKWLFDQKGSEPWSASKACWNK